MVDTEGLMTIGAVSRGSGIPANTLRTWERRYGFPTPVRTDGGQRVYQPDVVAHLRLVGRALELGHRPRQILPMPLQALQELLDDPAPAIEGPGIPPDWIRATQQLDGPALDVALRQELARIGALPFLTQRVGPFLTWVGDQWATGGLGVHQEHFAAGRVRAVLDETWRSLAPTGPIRVVCATLPGELHDLGVHMSALAVASGWRRPLVLPGPTPVEAIVDAAKTTGAELVAISLSVSTRPEHTYPLLEELRSSLPSTVQLWIGGSGAPAALAGAEIVTDLERLAARA